LEPAGWGDVIETPYVSRTGWIGTGTLFTEAFDSLLELGSPGRTACAWHASRLRKGLLPEDAAADALPRVTLVQPLLR
jgi:hypothetical protein